MDTWSKPPMMGPKPDEAREDELTAQTLELTTKVEALAVLIRAAWEGTDLAQVADFHARKLAQTCGDIRSWLGGVE